MQAAWLIGLGASTAYLLFKQKKMTTQLENTSLSYDNAPGHDAPASGGVTTSEIKRRWAFTEDTEQQDFHEKLPPKERAEIKAREKAQEAEVRDFDQQGQKDGEIIGCWMECIHAS